MEPVDIPKISYGEFSKRLHERIVEKRVPAKGIIEVTHRCNFRCIHCYVPHESTGPELTTQELYEIIDVIVDEGCMWLLFTGGEPFVRSDFMDVYTYAKRRGLVVTIFTNGSLIIPEIADRLRDLPPFLVSITVYGVTEETYRNITSSVGLYDRCMRGIDLLLDRGVPLELKTVLMIPNKREFQEIKRFAESLGVKFRYDHLINARLDGSNEPCKVRIPPEEAVTIDMSDQKVVEQMKKRYDRLWGAISLSRNLFTCGAGMNSFVLDPYGKMCICLMVRRPSHGIRGGPFRDRFREGFYDIFPKIRSVKRTNLDYKCANCEMVRLCDKCPGYALLEYGDPEGIWEYACEFTHLWVEGLKKADWSPPARL